MREKAFESRLSLDKFMRVSVNIWDVLFDINHIDAKYFTELTICQKKHFYRSIAKAVGRGVLNSNFKRQNSTIGPHEFEQDFYLKLVGLLRLTWIRTSYLQGELQ